MSSKMERLSSRSKILRRIPCLCTKERKPTLLKLRVFLDWLTPRLKARLAS
jgi:hypothetical protein